MRYTVESYTENNEPFFAVQDDSQCNHIVRESWSTQSGETCINAVTDFLDAPLAELSLEEVKRQFSSRDMNLPESKALQIQAYYNGRLALYEQALADLKPYVEGQQIVDSEKTFIYDIPEKYNQFEPGENESRHQLCSYIKVTISNEEQESKKPECSSF